ncbi:MAG: type III secretion system inner membrane ring subunit SctD [Desulfovibrio sp.]|jgi:type III secretion system YscD/HrpQ family protein|nr:type III secretion system inner membrane ring subunit SctD [Desulfovibrio sp.]
MDTGILLGIFTGNHAGAELPLAPGEYVLGSAEDCDVVLSDRSFLPRHCVLAVSPGGEASLAPLEGTVNLRGEDLAGPLDWPALTPVLAGLVCLAWAGPGQSWAGMTLPSLLPPDGNAAQDGPPPAETGGKTGAPPPVNGTRQDGRASALSRFGAWGLSAAAVILLLGLCLDLPSLSGEKPGDRAAELEKELRGQGFSSLRVEEAAGRVVVYGLAPTADDANRIRRAVAGRPYPVRLVVREREEFIRSVQSALSAHGLFLAVVPRLEEAELQGYVLDALVENAALSWAHGAGPPVFPIRSALLTRAGVEQTLAEELARAGLKDAAAVEWLPGVISLAGVEEDKDALAAAMEATRARLDSPLAFRLALKGEKNLPPVSVPVNGGAGEARQTLPEPGNPFGQGLSLRSVTVAGNGGRLPFITTSDGMVYFAGGLLPNGYVLTGIHADRLEFFKNGAIVAYKLQGR